MTPVRVAEEDGLLVLTFVHPILTRAALESARRVLAGHAAGAVAIVVESAHPSIFLAGAHLGEIAALDAVESGRYAAEGRRLMAAVAAAPCPVVAAVHGTCAGGGLDLALACDRVVASREARLGHPGIRRGLVTGWGGTAELAGRVPPVPLLGLIASGALLPADRAAALGLVDEIAADPRARARSAARGIAALDPARLALWRALRSAGFIDRFDARVVHTR